MRPLYLRGVLATALIVSLALKFQATRDRAVVDGAFDMRRAVTELTRLHGWTEQAPSVPLRPSLRTAMYFAAPGCSRAAIVVPVALNLEIVSLLGRIVEPGYRKRFYYIEHTAPVHRRIALYSEWMKHYLLSLAGLTRYLPARSAVMVAEPPDCHASEHVDWRLIWERG